MINIVSTSRIAALILFASPAFAVSVTNGSFEANSGNFSCATGWSCSTTNFGEETVGFWNAQGSGSNLATSPDGGNVLAAWYIGSGESISQTLSGLTIGSTYTLTFSEADANRSTTSFGAGTMDWQASIGGTVLNTVANSADIAIAGAQSATAWSTVNYSFVASASSELLKFLAQSSVAVAPEPIMLLDGVKVQPQVAPVPEPGTYALMLAGIAAVTFVAKRRKAK